MVALAALIGVALVLPIGAADMPVVIALLNSYAGLAGCATGLVLDNKILIVTGEVVIVPAMIFGDASKTLETPVKTLFDSWRQ